MPIWRFYTSGNGPENLLLRVCIELSRTPSHLRFIPHGRFDIHSSLLPNNPVFFFLLLTARGFRVGEPKTRATRPDSLRKFFAVDRISVNSAPGDRTLHHMDIYIYMYVPLFASQTIFAFQRNGQSVRIRL